MKVSCTLLRNGKRGKEDRLSSQTRMRGQERKSGERDVRSECGVRDRTGGMPVGDMGESGSVVSAEDVGERGGLGKSAESVDRGDRVERCVHENVGVVDLSAGVEARVGPCITGELVDDVFRSSVVENINALRGYVAALRSEVNQLKGPIGVQHWTPVAPEGCCLLYVHVPSVPTAVGVQYGTFQLEQLLGCRVLQYLRVQELPNLAFRVKIMEKDLQKAMDFGRKQGCLVDLWRRFGANSQVAGMYNGRGGEETQGLAS